VLPTFWPDIKQHLRRSSAELLQHYMRLLDIGSTLPPSTAKHPTYSTFKTAMGHPLGSTVVLYCLRQLGQLHAAINEEARKANTGVAADLWRAVADTTDLASPLETVRLEYRPELGETAEQKRLISLASG
jgi:hypothetical protein